MTSGDDVLSRLTSALPWKPDWADVLGRAGELDPRRRQPWARRRLILALSLLAAVLIPLVALAAANGWFFG